MVVWIVGIVMVAHVAERYLRMRSKQQSNGRIAEDTEARMVELEERIRVLERIVTEHKFDLKRQINDL